MEENTPRILVIGADPSILATVLRLLNDHKPTRYMAAGADGPNAAKQLFTAQPFDLVLMTNGIDQQQTKELAAWFRTHKPGIPVIQHYGGGSGLLFGELNYFLMKNIS
jgi:DNA-binding response OmpR family regulator